MPEPACSSRPSNAAPWRFGHGAWLCALAVAISGLTFPATAPAHTLSMRDAVNAAERWAFNAGQEADLVQRPISEAAWCMRLNPHQFRCLVKWHLAGGDTCTDKIVPHYAKHSGRRVSWKIEVHRAPERHPCF